MANKKEYEDKQKSPTGSGIENTRRYSKGGKLINGDKKNK